MDSVNSVSQYIDYSGGTRAENDKAMREANKAISQWGLQKCGWRGFQQFDWVQDITNKYPDAEHIAHTCSSHNQDYLEKVADLFDSASSMEDKKQLHKYFVGKLALEELSCRLSGAAGGLCDKKRAYLDICRMTGHIINSKG